MFQIAKQFSINNWAVSASFPWALRQYPITHSIFTSIWGTLDWMTSKNKTMAERLYPRNTPGCPSASRHIVFGFSCALHTYTYIHVWVCDCIGVGVHARHVTERFLEEWRRVNGGKSIRQCVRANIVRSRRKHSSLPFGSRWYGDTGIDQLRSPRIHVVISFLSEFCFRMWS